MKTWFKLVTVLMIVQCWGYLSFADTLVTQSNTQGVQVATEEVVEDSGNTEDVITPMAISGGSTLQVQLVLADENGERIQRFGKNVVVKINV